jgi:hypothetical protein
MKSNIFVIFILSLLLTGNSVFCQKELITSYPNFTNGDLISSDDGTLKGNLYKSNCIYDPKIVGVYIQNATNSLTQEKTTVNSGEPVKVTKSNITINEGIAFVKYNSENGSIKAGDPLTTSSVPGEAMKAIGAGVIIGIALDNSQSGTGLIKTRILIQYLKQ